MRDTSLGGLKEAFTSCWLTCCCCCCWSWRKFALQAWKKFDSFSLLIDTSPALCEPRRIIMSTWSYWNRMEMFFSAVQSRESRKWWRINCGFKKSISVNRRHKSRFSFELQNSFQCANKKATNVDDEIEFRMEFISALTDWSVGVDSSLHERETRA